MFLGCFDVVLDIVLDVVFDVVLDVVLKGILEDRLLDFPKVILEVMVGLNCVKLCLVVVCFVR